MTSIEKLWPFEGAAKEKEARGPYLRRQQGGSSNAASALEGGDGLNPPTEPKQDESSNKKPHGLDQKDSSQRESKDKKGAKYLVPPTEQGAQKEPKQDEGSNKTPHGLDQKATTQGESKGKKKTKYLDLQDKTLKKNKPTMEEKIAEALQNQPYEANDFEGASAEKKALESLQDARVSVHIEERTWVNGSTVRPACFGSIWTFEF